MPDEVVTEKVSTDGCDAGGTPVGFSTTTGVDTEQVPVLKTILVVPEATEVTVVDAVPTLGLTVATPVALLVHVPVVGVPVRTVEPGRHILVVPVTVGVVPTVTALVAAHVLVLVAKYVLTYEMVAAPLATPVTLPEPSTLALADELDHTPDAAPVSDKTVGIQTVLGPAGVIVGKIPEVP